jgi:hypothetical protein
MNVAKGCYPVQNLHQIGLRDGVSVRLNLIHVNNGNEGVMPGAENAERETIGLGHSPIRGQFPPAFGQAADKI